MRKKPGPAGFGAFQLVVPVVRIGEEAIHPRQSPSQNVFQGREVGLREIEFDRVDTGPDISHMKPIELNNKSRAVEDFVDTQSIRLQSGSIAFNQRPTTVSTANR